MKILSEKDKFLLARFEHLPDSAAVPLRICALISGLSERQWRAKSPIPTFYVSEGKRAANVGQLRKLTRGEL
jgi:hypothetical protein